jgi:homotetrameric cytidine deaminase
MPRWPTRASGISAEEALDHAEPGAQDRDHDDVVAEPVRRAVALERRLDVDLREPQVAQRLEADQHRRLAQAPAELARRRVLVAQHAEVAGDERVVDDGHSGHARARYSLDAMSVPRRNVELKAVDPDPARTLSLALGLGPSDEGVIVQRDTYFRVAEGRLKLREEEPGEAHLIAYSRPDDADVRLSSYRVVPAGEGLLAAMTETLGVDVVVEKRRHLLLWETVRIHLDEVSGLGSFVELEAVAGPARTSRASARRSRTSARRWRSASCARARTPTPSGRRRPDAELLRLAREAAGRAYAPYSNFPVGAAVRTEDGRRYAGANVENAAYPQGQCAEASALGAMVAGGGGRVVEVVVAAPSEAECAPCGGCRQRLREFAAQDAPIHLADLERVRRTTSLAELLPRSFGPRCLG